jgi:hypothetical protein
MLVQRPQDNEALRGIDGYEQMVNTFAKTRRLIGDCGGRVVETWAEQQCSYLQWLRQNYGEGSCP